MIKPIVGDDGFYRQETNPGAVINKDTNALKAYKLRKQKENEINNIKQEVAEIKEMLKILIENKNK